MKQTNLLKLLVDEIKSGLELYKEIDIPYLEEIIRVSSDNKDSLTIKESLTNEYVKIVREIKDPEKKIKYCQKILDTDVNEDAKLLVYFQVAEYFYNRDDKKNTLSYLKQAFDLLKDKKDKIIKKEEVIDIAYMFIYFDEIEKGLDSVLYANELENKRKKPSKGYLRMMGDMFKPKS